MPETKSNRFTKYFPLLLDVLRTTDPMPRKPAEARDWIAAHTSIEADDLDRKILNGEQSIFENDVHWARFYLSKAGLLSSQKRGQWSLTPAGRDTFLTPGTTWELYVRIRDANRPGATDEEAEVAPSEDVDSEARPSFWFAGAFWGDAENDHTCIRSTPICGHKKIAANPKTRGTPRPEFCCTQQWEGTLTNTRSFRTTVCVS